MKKIHHFNYKISKKLNFYSLVVFFSAILPLGFLGIFFLNPLFAMLLKGIGGIKNFWAVVSSPRISEVIIQTVLSSLIASIITVVIAIPLAKLLYCSSFRYKRILANILIAPFVMPSIVVGVIIKQFLENWTIFGITPFEKVNPFFAVVFAFIFFNLGFLSRGIGKYWAKKDLTPELSAKTLGAGSGRVFFGITLPSLLPAIINGFLISFLFCSTSFGVVMILGGLEFSNIEREIWVQTTQFFDLNLAAALSILQLCFVLIILIFGSLVEKKVTRNSNLVNSYNYKNFSFYSKYRLREFFKKGKILARLVQASSFVVSSFLVLVPLSFLVFNSFDDNFYGYKQILGITKTSQAGNKIENEQIKKLADSLGITPMQALYNSLRFAIIATIIALTIATMIAVFLTLPTKPFASTNGQKNLSSASVKKSIEFLFLLPLGVSSVLIGFGFLITLNKPPFDLLAWQYLLPVAMATVTIPILVRTLLPIYKSVNPVLRQATVTLGARQRRVFFAIDFPKILHGLVVCAGFSMALCIGEFGATSFLYRPDTITLPVIIYRLMSVQGNKNFDIALAACVMLALVSIVCYFLFDLLENGVKKEI